ncbi:hypothetical protein PI124_g1188 [Phytophthora idaei]|nr:hypothetical protein PI125_g1955 [Phytophthora idaei]KAG3169327.1 hypothetical protein PI126_g2872 [Phytophthora idaei]KAG3254208.1 hypothetical protein PI124_g1188 [Phytophthora idaei]
MHGGGSSTRLDGNVGGHGDYPPATSVAHTLQYTPSARLKIFLSSPYGHDRFQALAFHLKAALQRRGHVVWLDIEKLSAGIDWEEGIAGGLSWVRDAGSDGRVLLVMTPHALRRPDGYCLNEVARAASLRLNIFPVMVAESAPPPSIAILPFFDMRDCVPGDVEQETHAKDSQEWRDLMKSCLETSTFLDKAERLYTILELFDSITSYGVPAVAGLANLSLFPGFDDPHLDTPRSSSVRRLLSSSPTRGRSAILDVPVEESSKETTSTLSTPSIQVDNAVSINEAESLGASSASPLVAEGSSATITEPKAEDDSAVLCRKTRYVLSYDESCYVLAQQIYEDLTESGFSVFPVSAAGNTVIIKEDEATGKDGPSSREDALQWASAEKDGKLVLLLTAESVGRPHGASLNDVSAAMSAGLGFVPLLVRTCEIPLSICRIQWLDMTDCLLHSGDGFGNGVTARLNRVRYESRKDQLMSALEGTLDHEGQQARLFSLLSPFNFQRQISHLTENFIGREWLFQQFQRWVQGSSASNVTSSTRELSNQRVFWVVGQIGSGKTSMAAYMAQSCPEIAAFHFATQEDEQTHNARRCILSLAYQLTTQLPEYAHYLQSHEPLEEMVPVASFVELVTHLLIGPLNAIARPSKYKSLVLLIDGVEWLIPASSSSPMPPLSGGSWRESKDEECFVSMLPVLVSRLPEWVRIVLLSREEPPVLSKLHAFDPPDVSIEQFQHENDQDIRRYITQSLSKLHLSDKDFEKAAVQIGTDSGNNHEFGMEQVVELIARRSEGLFLYAVNVVQAISEGRLRLHELVELPVGMGAYLQQFFASHFADHDMYKQRVRPVLEVCCAAYEPLPLATLARVLEWGVYEQRDATAVLGSLFSIEAGNDPESQLLRPFHSSVLDWVRDSSSSGLFFVDVASGHERLGRWAAREYQTLMRSNVSEFVNLNYELEATGDEKLKAEIYIVRNACNHLMQATGEDCMQLVAAFAADEKFQLARRLLHVRAEGLQSFFHGDISREKAQELLARRQPHRVGSFLIRYTSRQRTYCASFVTGLDEATGAPKFRHNLIHHLENGSYSTVPQAEVTEKTILYPDLISFVEQYQRKGVLTAPVARDAPLNREISR